MPRSESWLLQIREELVSLDTRQQVFKPFARLREPAVILRLQCYLEAQDCIGQQATPLAEQLRSEEHTSELQSPCNLVCRLLLEKKKTTHPLYAPLLLWHFKCRTTSTSRRIPCCATFVRER